METNIYMVRHAESIYRADDNDFDRPLSEKGKKDVKNITDFFEDLNLTRVFSSPYTRVIRTVEGIAKNKNLEIELINDFRERKVANEHIKDFETFVKRQWEDFNYSLEGGESLSEVQSRGIGALEKVLEECKGQNIVIGTHGTLLGVILNYFDKKYDYEFWETIEMPDIFLLSFKSSKLDFIRNIKIN